MPNTYFQFKQFTVQQQRAAMKVTTDSCFFGAWVAGQIQNSALEIRTLLDIGTGTGLLALMIAQKNDVEIDAVEIDGDAAQQAMENVSSSPWKQRIKVFSQNVLAFQSRDKYDCVVCNPPFYEKELNSAEQKKNIAHHSLEITIRQILIEVKKNLKDDGLFFLLFPMKREKEMKDLLDENGFYISKKIFLKPSVIHSAFRIIVMATTRRINETEVLEVSIWNEHKQYTAEFTALLKDYYLYL